MPLTRSERTALIWTLGFLTFGGLLKAHQEHEVRWGKAFLAPPPSDSAAPVREDSFPIGSPQQPSEKKGEVSGFSSPFGDSAALAGRKSDPQGDSSVQEKPVPTDRSASLKASAQVCPLSLNGATAAQLTGLPGIGPKMAEKIVSHRQEHGPFRKVGDLDQIKGIGQKKLDRIRSCLIL
jgi:competence ComEA-like helix-hairpin-helix protein